MKKVILILILMFSTPAIACDVETEVTKMAGKMHELVNLGVLSQADVQTTISMYQVVMNKYDELIDMGDTQLSEYANSWVCNAFETTMISLDMFQRKHLLDNSF